MLTCCYFQMTLSELEYCNHHSECKDLEQKWTYAIPLEVTEYSRITISQTL